MPGNEMYCHACHHQWRRESDAIECPACRSASTEIVREFPQGMPDARTLLTDEQITPENDPRQFHAQPAETIPAANVSAPAEPHPAAPQPAANTTPSDADQNMRDAPANEPESNPSNPSNDAAGSRSAHNGQGQRPEYIFVLPPPMVTFFTTVVTDTHVPPPNTAGPRGPPVTTHFSMNFFPPPIRHHTPPGAPPPTGVNSPPTGAETPAAQQNATDGPQPTARPQHTDSSLSWLELFLGPMLGIPPSASFGDAVFSQEALDRIITRLREQSGPGGAPPASQAAIDKLEVKELDEKMLGGEAKTRCVVCVDEMSVGDKASVLPCSHFFHGECVTPWLKQHNTCPVCRRSIEPEAVKPTKAAEFANDAHQEHQHEHATDAQGCS